jgi:hypothetical protein
MEHCSDASNQKQELGFKFENQKDDTARTRNDTIIRKQTVRLSSALPGNILLDLVFDRTTTSLSP